MRTWLKRIILAVLLLTGLYLLGINLFLNSPLASRAFNRRPHRFQIHWRSAWTVWPGLVHARGLKVEGWRPNVAWSVTAERAQGWIDLGTLAGRSFRVRDLHGEEVRSTVIRRPGVGAPDPPRRPGEGQAVRRKPWRMSFEGIVLDHVREFRFNDFRLTGDGRAEGAFWFVMGGNFRLEPAKVRLPAARLWLGSDTFAQGVDLTAGASLGPYRVRDHLGLEGFDFLSGSLKARGRVPELPFLDRAGLPGAEGRRPGKLLADLRVQRGHLQPGSRFEVTAPADGSTSPFILAASVGEGQDGSRLRLRLDARGFSAGRQKNGPPLFRSKVLSVASATPETRLSRIFATARDLRAHAVPVSLPLQGDVRAEGVQIEAPGSRAILRASFDHATGRVDLPGLLARDIDIEGLLADGIAARLELVKTPPPSQEETAPISVRIANARFTRVHEVSLGQFLLAGDLRAETTFSYQPDGTLAVDRAAVAMPSGIFRRAGQTAAQDLFLKVETRIEPSILGQTVGLAFLRYVSGTATLRSRISSLGFLDEFFRKTPWLSLQGQGRLDADVRLDHGKLTPGTRIGVNASPVRATVFDSLATGRGTLSASVAPGRSGPVTSLNLRFDRFGLEDLRRKGRPDYIRGSGLRISAAAPGALDLTAPPPDFDAVVDLPEAEVPDLSVYDALLPDQAGLAIMGGQGRARLHLEVSTATRKARGSATLTSKEAQVQLQNLLLQGNLLLQAPLASPDLDSRRFDLKGTRLVLDRISYRDVGADGPAEAAPWWARAEIESGSIVWGAPLSLQGQGKAEMKNAGPLLTLFAQRSRFLRWFDDVLNVENVTARGTLRMGDGNVQIESLQATGGPLEVRSRMIFSKDRRLGDLYLRYGRLAAGIELRDGQRKLKLRRPLDWYEGKVLP
ncbi:MAG TPA: hypothetical protein VHC97_00685 [Thermoanaerobaculia bacterium]|nr:hypothetical protein [Thermoanaerobaculia bacterium]